MMTLSPSSDTSSSLLQPITSSAWLEDEEKLKMKKPLYQLHTSHTNGSPKWLYDWFLLRLGLLRLCYNWNLGLRAATAEAGDASLSGSDFHGGAVFLWAAGAGQRRSTKRRTDRHSTELRTHRRQGEKPSCEFNILKWRKKKKEEHVWFHVMFFLDSFLLLPSVRISLTCSCSSFSLNWWRPKRARCSPDLQRWRRRRWESGRRWYGDTFPSPKESARQAAAASSGRPSHHADTTSQRWEWEFHLTLTW